MIGNMFTLKDARDFCAKNVADGRDPDDPFVIQTLDECQMILINEGDFKGTKRMIRFKVRNNSIALPREAEAILRCAFDSQPAYVHTTAYEYLDGGPGILGCYDRDIPYNDLVDMGDGHPTFWPIGGTARKIVAISTHEEDTNLTIRVRGVDQAKNEILPTAPGEDIPIARWKAGSEGRIVDSMIDPSENEFLEIRSIVKPVTAGYVTLYAYNPDTKHMWGLGKYHPNETQPSYRRYKVTGRSGYDTSDAQSSCLVAQIKLRWVPLLYDSDVLLIQNLPALRIMCQSIHMRNLMNTQKALELQADALRMLDMQLRNANPHANEIDVRMSSSFASIPEMH